MASLAAVLGVGFAPVPRPKPAKPDFVREELARLRGSWVKVRFSCDGEAWVKDANGTHTIEGDRLSTYVGRDVIARWKVVLRPGGEPGAMNLNGGERRQLLCAYKLAGDEMTLAWALPGGKGGRPPDVKPRGGVWVVVYKRAKKKP